MKEENQNSQTNSFVSNDSYVSHIDRNYFKNVSFFSKQFCLPKEIKLNEDRQGIKSYENGLQIVERANIDDIHPTSRDITDATLREFKQDGQDSVRFVNGDGLISMFKNRVQLPIRAKVAICITVYSEDKIGLKRTLDGVKSNYKIFLQKAGILSHEIIVVVIFDGIEKVNNSSDSQQNMVSIFRDFDLMNGFRKKEYQFAKRFEEGNKEKEKEFLDDDKNQLQNYDDDMIFTEAELEDLQDCLFETQYSRYMQMCKLIKYVKQLSKKDIQKLAINEMPKKIKIFFMENARKFMAEHNINNVTEDDDQLQKYLEDNMARQKLQMLKFQSIKWAEKVAKDYISSRESTAILYQMAIPINPPKNKMQEYDDDPNLRFYQEQPRMYTFFAVKHANSGKLSSHLWFFQGFCNIMQPDVCILLDCGLKPSDNAIFKMWAHIETYKKSCGGVCGYMSLSLQNPCDDLGYRQDDYDQNKVDCLTHFCNYFFDIQKAQMFEYHFAHMLDKPFESWFGYIHVLPGAFSAYNWDALKHEKIKTKKKTGEHISQKQIEKKKKERILNKYLKTVIYHQTLDDIKEANMYLAEDRILCLEIYSKKNNHFNLEYLPDAQSTVDPVTSLIRMLGQRKRWINGSWFALQYVLENRRRVNESDHSNWDKFKFRTNMFYSAFNKALAYVGISLFFIILHFMIQQFAQNQFLASIQNSLGIHTQLQLNQAKVFYSFFNLRSLVNSLAGIVDFCYILVVGVSIFYSLTLNKHTEESKKIFNFITTIFGIYGVLSVILVFYNFFSTVISKSQGAGEITDSFLQTTGILSIDSFMYILGIIVIIHLVVIIVTFDLKKYFEIILSLPSYFFFVPTYIHTLFIYAFCRIDDLSWGTKGLDSDNQKKQASIGMKFKNEKLRFVFRWVAVNVALCITCITLSNERKIQTALIWMIAFYVLIILIVRFLFAMIYLAKYYFIIKRKVKSTTLSQRKRIERITKGREIKENLKNYIDEVKNYKLDDHVVEINEELKNQSILHKIIDQQQMNVIDQHSKLFEAAYQNSKSFKIDKSNFQKDKKNNQLIDNNNSSGFKSRTSKKNKVSIHRQKIFARANDNKPILAQIFGKKPIGSVNQPIQFEDIQKLAELQKVREKVKRYKIIDHPSKIIQKNEKSQQQEQQLIEMPQQTGTKQQIFSTNPELGEQQKFDDKEPIISIKQQASINKYAK